MGTVLFGSDHFANARYKKVTICPRVQTLSGEKVVAEVPLVTPCATAQATAFAYVAPAGTSVNLAAFAEGLPAAFHIYSTAMLRVQGAFGVTLEAIPFSTAHRTAWA